MDALRRALQARAPGRYRVSFGAKHTDPLLEEAASRLAASGVDKVIGLVLTPHASSMGSGEYLERAASRAGPDPVHRGRRRGTPSRPSCGSWPGACAAAVDGERRTHRSRSSRPTPSPERVRAAGDTYPEQLEESARLVAPRPGLADWSVAWQSAGRTPEPWLGPDIRDEVRRLAAEGGTDAVVVCPIGFVADHLEVLYDLDIELAAVAAAVGLAYARTASLNDDPAFVDVLADVVVAADGAGLTWRGGRVVVVGGGISGLSAAWELTGGAEPERRAPAVVVLEASDRLGGALRSDEFGGRTVDLGPDGFLGRRTEAVELADEVGLGDALVPIAGRGASVFARGRLRPLPEGLALGVPTRFWPTARSGVLGPRGRLGLLRDALLPKPDVRGPLGDRSVGPLVTRKLGAAGDRCAGRSRSSAASTPGPSTTCQRPPCSRRCSPRPDAGAVSCGPCGPRCRRPTPTDRRSSGRSTAAWPRW